MEEIEKIRNPFDGKGPFPCCEHCGIFYKEGFGHYVPCEKCGQ